MKKLKALAIVMAALAAPAHAVSIGGVEFPQGAVSFADVVVSYAPAISSGEPTAAHRIADNALGVPDYDGINSCGSVCSFVSLGDGGAIVLQFTDNKLTGSGTPDDDLWIFEIGPDVEDTFVWISQDGVNWRDVGFVGGSTSGIDLDAHGYGVADQFAYVMLQDDGAKDGQSGTTVGADIDAVGAISTVLTPIPEPQTYALLLAGLALLGFGVRARTDPTLTTT